MQSFMASYDIILSPGTAVAANEFLADDTVFDPYKNNTDCVPFSYLFNLSQQPAVTVPIGVNQLGMPISVQLTGAVGADALVLSVAKLVQSMLPMPHPPLFY
jgi:aspartyl-tRNA(Asn)/glutamyl-tRNA(Gln) amidotransferase subunit A